MKLDALRFASFSSLGEAITDWSQMVTKLKALSDDADKQLEGRAGKANWKGVNATVTKNFITKTSREFGDAQAQAQSIHNILNDAKNELEGYKKQLNDRIDRGKREHGLTVTESGDSFTVTKMQGPYLPGDPKSPAESSQADADALRDDISAILEKATTTDTTAADAVKSIVSATERGFANITYKDRDSAAAALREAEKLAALAKDVKNLSPEDLKAINDGMAKYKGDDLFAERFAVKLGPEGVLNLWRGINDNIATPELEELRDAATRGHPSELSGLQENLSLTLANATQSDSPAMRSWEHRMVGLGDNAIQQGTSSSKGFVVMSSLMRYGDYDDKFLGDYGKKLIDHEKEMTQTTDAAGQVWYDHEKELPFPLNHTGSDTGIDPMTGYMDALGHSPEAAEKFLNADYGDLQSDEPVKTLTNFEYLFEERNWPEDSESSDQGHNAMAHAIHAATTGHPFDKQPSLENIPHTQGQAELYAAVVESVSEDRNRLADHMSMSDSFGQMSAEYMPDIHRALDPTQVEEDKLYPLAGAAAPLHEDNSVRDMTRFLHTVGRDPEGYAAINIGQHHYTANLMQYHFQHPDAFSPDGRADMDQTIRLISERAGEIQGTIGDGRADELVARGSAEDKAFNEALDGAKGFTNGLIGIGAGIATAPFTGPGAIIASGAATIGAEELLNHLVPGLERNHDEELKYRTGGDLNAMKNDTSEMVSKAAREGGRTSIATDGAQAGFNNAHTNLADYVDK
jgi:hypothetical protein